MSDDRIGRIENKIDKLSEHLGSIDATLAAQHVSLKEHMRRTAILEEQMGPIKGALLKFQGVLKLISIIAIVATIGEGVVSVLGYLK